MYRIGPRTFCMLIVGLFAPIAAGCSSDDLGSVSELRVPSPPTEAAVLAGVKTAASEARLAPPLEMSAVRLSDHGPGRYFICLRGTWSASVGRSQTADDPAREPSLFDPPSQPAASERRVIYSVFFNNDVYKDARQSVIIDSCETQAFTPIDLSPPAPPPPPPPPPKSTKSTKRSKGQ